VFLGVWSPAPYPTHLCSWANPTCPLFPLSTCWVLFFSFL
jgi:hypothetical protein